MRPEYMRYLNEYHLFDYFLKMRNIFLFHHSAKHMVVVGLNSS